METLRSPPGSGCFTLSRYDRNTGKWDTEKAPVYHIIERKIGSPQ